MLVVLSIGCSEAAPSAPVHENQADDTKQVLTQRQLQKPKSTTNPNPSRPKNVPLEKSMVQLGRIESQKIVESSGLALSHYFKDAFWTLNDSGNSNEIYLISFDGKLLSTVELKGVKNLDWEAMCPAKIDGQNFLIIGDVGDNGRRRKYCELHLIREPSKQKQSAKTKPISIKIEYPDGAVNCEAIGFEQIAGQNLAGRKTIRRQQTKRQSRRVCI